MKKVVIHSLDRPYGEYLTSLIDHLQLESVLCHDKGFDSERLHTLNPGSLVLDEPGSLQHISRIKRQHPDIPLLLITEGSVDSRRLEDKVYALNKPLEPNHFLQILFKEHNSGSGTEGGPERGCPIEPYLIGNSQSMRDLRRDIARISCHDLTVLLLGQTGTGKGVVAFSLHNNSYRRCNSYMEINCANLPANLMESELFGYKQGAFTGAWKDKLGKFALAGQGTVFLDEISEMPPSTQSKLLQVLQDGEFSPIGGDESIHVNVRIIAATNADMKNLLIQERFRHDLYYRLAVICISLPPLRERKEDIPALIAYFLDKYARTYQKATFKPSSHLNELLMRHSWPGNVRELENVIKTLAALENEQIVIEKLQHAIYGPDFSEPRKTLIENGASLKEASAKAAAKAESEIIRKSLRRSAGNKKKAAELLDISYKSLLNKVKHYKIS